MSEESKYKVRVTVISDKVFDAVFDKGIMLHFEDENKYTPEGKSGKISLLPDYTFPLDLLTAKNMALEILEKLGYRNISASIKIGDII